jgi:hypothetical protein
MGGQLGRETKLDELLSIKEEDFWEIKLIQVKNRKDVEDENTGDEFLFPDKKTFYLF